MSDRTLRKKVLTSQRGVALTEAAIAFPLWVILLAIFGELYGYLNSQMQLQQLVREGLEMAATMPEMSDSPYKNFQLGKPANAHFKTCVNNPPATRADCGARILHTRIARLAESYNLRVDGDPFSNINISSDKISANEIQLNLSYTYRPLMGHFMGVKIRASASGPYLCGIPGVFC